MSWFDDLFGEVSDDVSSYVSDAPEMSSIDWDALSSGAGDVASSADTYDWSSNLSELLGGVDGATFEYPDMSEVGGGSLMDVGAEIMPSSGTAVEDYLQTLGIDTTPATFDLGPGLHDNPVASSQLWDKLNTASDPIYSAALDGNSSTPALLSALTDRGAGYSMGDMGNSFGAGLNTDSGFAPGSVYDTGSGSSFGAGLGVDLGSGLDTGLKFNLSALSTPASWLAKLLAKSGQGKKSNLGSGIGALAMASQVAGALAGKDKPAPSVSQHGTTGMSWNKSVANKGKKLAVGGDVGGGGDSGAYPQKPCGALGLLRGSTMGQADKVPINAAHGEYVMDADIVSALGDGNTDAGAAKLDKMRERIRTHKRSAPSNKIPPKAKEPMAYMRGTK